ncbi:competence/damage-inducible protein A [Odoribacter lunatus]|uniref:competence/damage-inducible protein A n=1 Tax=Odoribacter lunatus TaxID=2941335 RepID=UPI00203C083C|nr:competence/damage-inducible protein A [Odoribacter lunatus]
MYAVIITIGDEILLGQILDTNSRYMANCLTGIGVEVVEMLTVSDKHEEIWKAVDHAMRVADLVLVTGGLGPTKDDVTKKVLAEYFGCRLVFNEEAMEWLKELLKGRGIALNENNRGQAVLPDNCRILRNFKGTASGMWFEREGKELISMPGVPFEMEHLMTTYVVPDLQKKYPRLQVAYRMLRVYDIPESELAEHLEAWEDALPQGIGLAYLPSPGWVKLRVTAKGEAMGLLDTYYGTLKEALQGLHYNEGEEENIEKRFGRVMREKGLTVATAESCTGGYIAHLITQVAGCSDYFKGSVVAYSNEVKAGVLGVDAKDIETYGAVSETVVRQMAEGVRRVTGADCAVATSGIAGPGGGTEEKPVGTVWIGVAMPDRTIARKFVFSSVRERNIAKAAVKALELLMEEM